MCCLSQTLFQDSLLAGPVKPVNYSSKFPLFLLDKQTDTIFQENCGVIKETTHIIAPYLCFSTMGSFGTNRWNKSPCIRHLLLFLHVLIFLHELLILCIFIFCPIDLLYCENQNVCFRSINFFYEKTQYSVNSSFITIVDMDLSLITLTVGRILINLRFLTQFGLSCLLHIPVHFQELFFLLHN